MSNTAVVDYVPQPKQAEMHISPATEILFGGAAGGGKGQSLSAKILTPFGYRAMRDMVVGSFTCNPDGTVCKAIGVFPLGIKQLYKVSFDDGTSTEVTEDHLWLTKDNHQTSRIRYTHDLMRHLGSDGWHIIPVTQPVEMKGGMRLTHRPVDPYYFGVLLAHGAVKDGVPMYVADEYVVERIMGRTEITGVKFENNTLRWSIDADGAPAEYIGAYEFYNLPEDGRKYIPDDYLLNNAEDRWELLRGLMDVDGWCGVGGEVFLRVDNETMLNDVRFLARSLGAVVKDSDKMPEGVWRKDKVGKYCLSMKFLDSSLAFGVTWKKDYGGKENELFRKIISIEKAGEDECQCIQVNHPNGLYITNDVIVTHNSKSLRMDALKWCVNIPGLQVYLFRRTFPELEKTHIISSKVEFPDMVGKYREQMRRWEFVNGSMIHFCHCQYENDVFDYQGAEIHILYLDEATSFTEFQYDYLRARVRCTLKIPKKYKKKIPRIVCATNPGGIGHCIPHGDVLTPDGWKDIRDMKVGNSVYTVNDNGFLVRSYVAQVHKQRYEGDMVHVKSRGLNIECTPHHKIAKLCGTKDNMNKLFTLVPFKELPGQANLLRVVKWEGTPIGSFAPHKVKGRKRRVVQPESLPGMEYAELMGWMLSEGHACDVNKKFSIAQFKQEQRDKIENLLKRCNFWYNKYEYSFDVHAKDWWNYFRRFGMCREKYVPNRIKNATVEELRVFFNAAVDGDGHWVNGHKSGHYYTLSKQLADDMCEIALKLGYVVSMRSRQRENRNGLSYEVYFKTIKNGCTVILTGHHIYDVDTNTKRKSRISYKPFSGDVYCIGIQETHNFIIRQNGTVWISGNSFCKERWVDYAEPLEIKRAPEHEGGMLRQYIPSKLQDNAILMERDPGYINRLDALPEPYRTAYKNGDWNIFFGQAFDFDRRHHVIAPLESIPENYPMYMTFDWGFGRPFSIGWWCVDNDDRLIRFDEWYGWNGTPDQGLRLTDSQIAEGILEKELSLGIAGRDIIRISGPDCFSRKPDYKGGGQGKSTAEVFADYSLYLTPGDPDRKLKYRQFRERLRIRKDDDGNLLDVPMLIVTSNCEAFIRTIPTIQTDPKNPEEIARGCEDHALDETCLICMSRAIGDKQPKKTVTFTDKIIDRIERPVVDHNDEYVAIAIRDHALDDAYWDIFATGEGNLDGIFLDTIARDARW